MVSQARHRPSRRTALSDRGRPSVIVPIVGLAARRARRRLARRQPRQDAGRVLPALPDRADDGALYALVALGYTLVYGILELINFAHGDVFMLGAMIAATFALTMLRPRRRLAALGTWSGDPR